MMVFLSQNQTSRRAITRDNHVFLVIAACNKLEFRQDTKEVEDKAALLGIQLMKNQGHNRVILELGSSIVATTIQLLCQDKFRLWDTCEGCKIWLKRI
jgi:hypothetical protein